jgi:predicted permease
MGRLLRRLTHVLFWSRLDSELREEIETHRALRQAQFERDGMTPDAATRESRRRLGAVALAQDDARDLWLGSLDACRRDVRDGLRAIGRRPVFASLAVATLALAIGANLVVFTVVNALWLRPPAVPEPDRVAMVTAMHDFSGTNEGYFFGAAGLDRYLRGQPVLELVAGQVPTSGHNADKLPRVALPGVGEVEAVAVTFEYFGVMGLRITGRDFAADDDQTGAEPVAVISDALWQRAFDRSPDVIGSVIAASPLPLRVIGVAPAGFRGARLGERTDLWVPRLLTPRVAAPGMAFDRPSLLAFVRLEAGVSPAEAEAALRDVNPDQAYRVIPVSQLYGSPVGRTIVVREQAVLWVAAITAGLVMLAGCATLMALVLVHYERRRQELAIRMALGCGRLRLVRALAVELGALVAAGALGAFGAAAVGLAALPALSLPGGIDLGRLDLGFDWRVTATGALAAVVTLAAAAMLPITRSTRPDLVTDLVSAGLASTPSSLRLRRGVLSLHVAATLVVLIAAGLFVRTIVYGLTAGPGFDADRVVFVEAMIRRPWATAAESRQPDEVLWGKPIQDLRRVMDLVRGLPGVTSVAVGRSPIGLDAAASAATPTTVVIGGDERAVRLAFQGVEPAYIDTLGVRLLAGRRLTDADVRDPLAGEVPVLMTRSAAEMLWPDEQGLGQEFARSTRYSYRVVGLVDDIAFGSQRLDQRAGVFVPTDVAGGARAMAIGLTVRTNGDPGALVGPIRRAILEVVPNAPLVDVATAAEVLRRDLGRERLGAWFFSGFGLVALVLGVGGVFGLVAYVAESRRREMGVRMALGAMPGHVVRMVMAAGLWPVVIGTAAGLLAGALLSRAVAALLIGISPLDPLTYIGAAALMLLGATGAGFVAATRVRRVSPTEALRAE